jgi:hypothetical protein
MSRGGEANRESNKFWEEYFLKYLSMYTEITAEI